MTVPRRPAVLLAVLCGFGLLLAAQTAPSGTQGHIERVKSCLPPPVIVKDDPHGCRTLAERMSELRVPGVSIAVVHNGVIEWAQGFGVQRAGGPPVTADTLFQAGSISKPLAAMAALHLVQQGKLSLDSDVNPKLTTWKIPASAAAPGAVVTLRELLTHTAGFNVHGFPGYAADSPVPTLVQVLNGEKPANTAPIRLDSPPGKEPKYSGGGYTVMQQLLLDVAKVPFPKLLHDTVLAPIGMKNSTYEQPLPAELRATAATPYADDGTAVPGGAHTYPEMAAAGLWTTPSDLARYMIENQQSLQGKANHVLSRELTEEMVTRGLGLQVGGPLSKPYFSHGGVNEGYESLFLAYRHEGEGAAVMTNAEGGMRLASEIMSSIAVAYDWPDFRPVVRAVVDVDRTILARYVGTYELTPDFSITFSLDGNQLMTQATNQPKVQVFPESPTKFFLKVVDAEVEFFSDDKGRVTHMVLHQNGHEMKGVKRQ